MESFSRRIARQRIKIGLTQKQVAEHLNVPLSTYKEWEYGRRIQGEAVYVKLAEVLGINLKTLLTGIPSAKEDHVHQLQNVIDQIEEIKRSLISF